MTIVEMLGQSGVLTLLGMGVVFGFLVILVLTITVAGKIIHALRMDKDISAAPVNTGNKAQVTAPPVAVAISASVNEYRRK